MLQNSVISQLETYWHGIRAGRVVPSRADVDPRGIDNALEYAFILERIAPGMARFRLAGMHLSDLMGMEVRGMPLTTFFSPDARREVSDALEHVFEEPAIARFRLLGERGIGKPQNEASLVILPLKSDLGDISRALGALVYEGEIGRTPRRFSVTEMQIEPLLTAAGTPARRAEDRGTPASGSAAATAARAERLKELMQGFGETQPPFTPRRRASDLPEQPGPVAETPAPAPLPGKATHIPWLRVVSSED